MPEFKTPASDQDFHRNFAPIKPLMNASQAHFESARCLYCYDAPCVAACPTGIDIPLFIKQIHSGNLAGAAKTIYQSNYFGHSCGKVCPTEVLCEGSCVYNHQELPPVDIGRLQSFATRAAMETNLSISEIPVATGKKAAVIGAGPAGIACACELAAAGVEVEVFEAKELGSGLNVYGVAPYKITNEEALAELHYLQKQFGFRIHYRHPVKSREDLQRLEENFDLIFLGIGLGETSPLQLPGEDLPGVEGAVEFVENLRIKKAAVKVPPAVIILGAGNTAMDAASEAARMGAAEVTLVYRRSRESMGAYPFEFELAKSAGVKAVFNAAPVRISGNGKAESVEFIRTEENGSKLDNLPGSNFSISADLVLLATGQGRQRDFLAEIPDLSLDARGNIVADADTFVTGNPRYFAAGDVVSGGQEVVNAVANGKKAALAMLKKMGINPNS